METFPSGLGWQAVGEPGGSPLATARFGASEAAPQLRLPLVHRFGRSSPANGLPPLRLSAAEIAAFQRDGFLSLPQVTTPDEVARMRLAYDRLFAGRQGWKAGHRFDFAGTDEPGKAESVPQVLHPSRYERALRHSLFRANAHAIARQILGRSAKLMLEHAMLKPARTGGATPWHQDEAFCAKNTDFRYITIWMPLQPVDQENGCMEFIPGSHRGALTPHRRINGDPRIHGLEAVGVNAEAAVACPLPAGGATVHHWRTLHGTGPNRSDGPRRAYALCFGIHSCDFIVREDYPWNTGGPTVRQARAAASRHFAKRWAVALRDKARAVKAGLG